MSVAPPPQAASTSQPRASGRGASDQLIESRIVEACRALWWAELIRSVLRMVVVAIGVLLLWVVMDQWFYSPGRLVRMLASLALLAAVSIYFYRCLRPLLSSSIRPDYAARSLERDMPELRQALTSYVTLRRDREAGDLRSRVVRSIGASTATRLREHDALPNEATGTLRWWVATAVALAMLVGYAALSPKNTLQSAARLAAPMASIEAPHRVSISDVEPGNADAIAGRSLEVSAMIRGMRDAEEATCVWELPSGRQSFVLSEDPDTGRHLGVMELPHSASGSVKYSITAGDATAGPYLLRVQDVPVVALESIHYTPPKYTGQTPYTSSSGAITAVDGTTVRVLANTNRAVSRAKIEFNPRPIGDRIQATAGATEMEIDSAGTSMSVTFPLRSAQGRSAAVELEDYRILVWDPSGQGNPDPIIYPIRVIPDLAPEVAITVPASTPKEVPIDAQQIIEVHASDPDFGLKSVSLEIRAGIDLVDQPTLWSSEAGEKGHQVTEFPLRPSELRLRIGDTVQVVAIAADNRTSDVDPNVEANVVRTDPITLKIVASSGSLPEENDPNADGLSSPKDEASQSDDSEGQTGESGEEQAGGGGSGSGSEQQGKGDQGEGGGGSEGAGGESSEQDSSEQEGTGGTEGASQGKPDGGGGAEGEGEDSAGSTPSGDSPSGEQPPGEPSQGDQQEDGSGQQPQPGDGSDQQPGEGAGADGQDSSGTSKTDTGGQPSGDQPQPSAGEGGPNNDAGGQSESRPGAEAGDAARPDANSQQRPGEAGDPSSAESGGESGEGAQPKQAPDHDGETFERIREFLEKNRDAQRGTPQESAGEDSSSSQSAPDPGQDGGSSQPQDGSSSERAGSESARSDQTARGDQTAKGDESAKGDQAAGDQQQPDGQETGPTNGSQDSENQPGSGSDLSAGDSAAERAQGGSDREQTGDRDAQSPSAKGEPEGAQGAGAQGAGQEGSGETSAEQGDTSADQQDSKGAGESGEPASGDPTAASQASEQSEGETRSGGSEGQTASPQTGQPGDPNTTAKSSSSGSGETGESGEAGDDSAPPPDPANLEYTKEATDLVLDYLEQTREAPDPDLLEDLQWSKEDLQRFADRWRDIREMAEQSGGQGQTEVEEALRSLGLRPKDGGATTRRESADPLRGIRDAGNRKPPPAAFRDAFDAFRRAVGQQP